LKIKEKIQANEMEKRKREAEEAERKGLNLEKVIEDGLCKNGSDVDRLLKKKGAAVALSNQLKYHKFVVGHKVSGTLVEMENWLRDFLQSTVLSTEPPMKKMRLDLMDDVSDTEKDVEP
jgi:hypothetical protein